MNKEPNGTKLLEYFRSANSTDTEDTAQDVVVELVVSVLAPLVIVVNGATLAIAVWVRTIPPNMKMLIMNLNCTDTLFAIALLFPVLLSPRDREDGNPSCLLYSLILILTFYCTCLNVALIALDRLLALAFPAAYWGRTTTGRTKAEVACTWGLSALLTLLSHLGSLHVAKWSAPCFAVVQQLRELALWLLALVVLLAVLVTAGSYVYIGVKICDERRRRVPELALVSKRSSTLGGTTTTTTTSTSTPEKPMVITWFIISVVFTVCYLPLSMYLLITLSRRALGYDDIDHAEVTRFFAAGPLLNCLFNPFVYFWRLKGWYFQVTCRWPKFPSGLIANPSTATTTNCTTKF